MNVLNFDNNKTPLCEKHASDLEHAIHPQCQFCLTDKLSEYMFHAVEKYEEHKKLKVENEELKKMVMAIGEYFSIIHQTTFQPPSKISEATMEAQDECMRYYEREQQDDNKEVSE